MQALCGTSKLKEVVDPNHCATDILFPENSFAEDFSGNTLHLATMRFSVSEPAPTTACHFRMEINIGLSQRASFRAVDAISSILQGAGFRQYSRQSWESASCVVEESLDSLSDIFLEIQALDDQAKECIEIFQVSMCPGNGTQPIS